MVIEANAVSKPELVMMVVVAGLVLYCVIFYLLNCHGNCLIFNIVIISDMHYVFNSETSNRDQKHLVFTVYIYQQPLLPP